MASPAGIVSVSGVESTPVPPPSRRGLPPPCWSHDETLALIQSYRTKWHSLRLSNLRAGDWEDVAGDVTRRCSNLPSSTPKTSVQCRHKVEKLRKRFRSEHLRPSSRWPFFSLMETLDRPAPKGFRFTVPKALRSTIVNPSSSERAVRPFAEEMRRRLERKRMEKQVRNEDAVGGMISALRTVGDGLMRVERMKIDMARETERMRMEMELKRTEMMLDLQSQIVGAFVKGVVGGRVDR